MSNPIADPVAHVIEAFAVADLGPPDDDDSSQESSRRGRSSMRRVRDRVSRLRSLSPRNRPDEAPPDYEEEDGNEHLQALDNQTVCEMVVGASISDWFSLVYELRRAESLGQADEPASVSVLNTLKRFTNLPIDRVLAAVTEELPEARNEEETGKYLETIFSKPLKAYVKVYTGEKGGKYIFTVTGFKKYLTLDEKDHTVLKDPTRTTVKDFNPTIKQEEEA